MRLVQKPLFDQRLTLDEAIQMTADSINAYISAYRCMVAAFSGGKDSSVVVSLLCYLIAQGMIDRPEQIRVMMSDTRQEFLPLHLEAIETMRVAERYGLASQVVSPPLDQRMYVYMFGRGVPPAGSVRFRWCTRILKSDPMDKAIEVLARQYGEILVITGVRHGESAARDQRIALSCNKDGGECGQGWFQNSSKPGVSSSLAPILHWRLCNVEDWLLFFAPDLGFDMKNIIDIYGFEEDEQMNIRTGCAGCMLIEQDKALDRIIQLPAWSYLAPLKQLKGVYRELKRPKNRLRKWGERKKDGSLGKNQGRLGPLTIPARYWGLEQILAIQDKINEAAERLGRPKMWLINAEELARIYELIEAGTWPDGWSGDEPRGDVLQDKVIAEGVTLPVLIK